MVEMRSLDPETTALSLMLAVICSCNTPLLLLDGDLRVVAASASFCRAFQLEPASVPKSQFSGLGRGEWNRPQLTSLLEGTASGLAEVQAYEFDLKREGQAPGLLVMNARKLDYIDKVRIRLPLAMADVTDARASEKLKDNLLREKAILLQEVQHRVANSLQIIASIVMQSARKSKGRNWTLSVSDNGVGMPTEPHGGKPGLGTNIVEALAKRLEAEVQVSDANPGTFISIVHAEPVPDGAGQTT